MDQPVFVVELRADAGEDLFYAEIAEGRGGTIQFFLLMTSLSRAGKPAVGIALGLALGACGRMATQADAKFGDQHFKTAISLIELYRVRHGSYPSSLDQIDFIGDWDRIALTSVTYERLSDGYALDLVRGWIGKPKVSFPPGFWKGLGIRRSNVGGVPPAT